MKFRSKPSLVGSRKGTPGRRHHNRLSNIRISSFTPRVESLEERTVLSAMSVVNTDDSGPGSLRQAIIDANENEGADVVQFAQGLEGTISLTSGQLAITDELTIDGPGADMLTVSGSGTSRVFHVGGATVAIGDLTIADGLATDLVLDNPDLGFLAAGGGLLNLGGDVSLTNVQVTGNGTQGFLGAGGGVANYFGANMTVSESWFADNQSFGFGFGAGGGIFNDASTLTVNDSSFSSNKAIAAVGLNPDVAFSGLGEYGAIGGANGSTMSVTNSLFENNLAKAGDGAEGTGQDGGFAIGGAIGAGNGSALGYAQTTLDITGSTFSDNQAVGGRGADGGAGVDGGNGGPAFGGAVNINNGAQATISQSDFTGNQAISADGGNGGEGADGGHGGVYEPGAFLAGAGGAISHVGSSLELVDSVLSENVVQGGNGGQGGSGGNGGNGSANQGGAINVVPWGGTELNTFDVTNMTLTNNSAIAGRGGLAGDSDTRDGQDGNAVGGGLFAYSKSGRSDLLFLNITDSTVTGNVVQASADAVVQGGGILAGYGANVTLTNTDTSQNRDVSGDVEVVSDGYACQGTPTPEGNCVAAQQGDANGDGQFDRHDIEQVLQAGKYDSNEDAVWNEGDWNLDGRVDQADIIAALQAGSYVA